MTPAGAGPPAHPDVRSIRPPTLPEVVLRELRMFLITGKLSPGDPVRVDRLAAELGVSAVPVREALRVLLAEGRVEHVPHRGFTVTQLSVKDVEEIFLICGLLEAEALRRGVPLMDGAGIERMESLLAQIATVRTEADLWEVIAIHQEFHFVPMGYAALPHLLGELRKLWNHTDHYRTLYWFRGYESHHVIRKEHEALTAACAARDGELAVRVMEEHRAQAVSRLAEFMGPASDQGR